MAKIKITKDQVTESDETLAVLDETGSYEENDLITCYKLEDKEQEPYCKLEAKFISKGFEVYQ